MTKNRRIIAGILFIAIASFEGYKIYQDKVERNAMQQELLRKYRNTPDEEYTGTETSTSPKEKEENHHLDGNAIGGGGDNFVRNMDKHEKEEKSSRKVICPNCKGTGKAKSQCEHCKGTGSRLGAIYGKRADDEKCPWCDGTGEIYGTCSVCNGDGRVAEYK